MHNQRRSQTGAYLIVASVVMVVLVGIGALALDVGRLFVLRSQMQNAVDSAALAAAAELSRDAGAQARAEAAARNALDYESGISEVVDLLGVSITLEFFCAIGSAYDPDPSVVPNFVPDFCPLAPVGLRYYPVVAGNDLQSHYVRVTMDQSITNDAYSIPLFFLPVLNLFGIAADTQGFLQARALAGRNYFYCDYPPLMMCNPFEGAGQRFQDQMNPGEQIELADGSASGSWFPGEVGFLALNGTGASANAPFLADEGNLDCTNPEFEAEPGVNSGPMQRAALTRFDEYLPPGNPDFPPVDYPPDLNVIDYPDDGTDPNTILPDTHFRDPPADKFGKGHWDRLAYWDAFHAHQPWGGLYPTTPSGEDYITSGPGAPSTGMTRYQMYQWELSQNKLPVRDPAIQIVTGGGPPRCENTDTGVTLDDWVCEGWPDSIPDATPASGRRVFNVAVVNCTAQGLTGGRDTFTMFGQEGFAKIFLTESVKGDGKLWGEYIEWAQPGADSNIHIDVQLYE